MFGTTPQPLLQGGQLSTQMAPVAPMSIPLPDRELQVCLLLSSIGIRRYSARYVWNISMKYVGKFGYFYI